MHNPRKRPRPVVSCLRCRDKKLKCDRTAPCENCVKASTGHTCTYKRHAGQHESAPAVPTSDAMRDLQARMARVEELLGVGNETEKESDGTPKSEKVTTKMLGTVVVKGDRSVYHGVNDRVTLMRQVRDVMERLCLPFSLRPLCQHQTRQ